MRILTSLLEILLLIILIWLVFPKLIFGREFTHIFPGIRLSTNLSLKHLVQFAFLILFYSGIYINKGPGILGMHLARLSPTVKVIFVFFIAFGIYMHALPGHTGDTIPTKLLPISIIEEGDLDLDEFRYAIFGGHHYSMIQRDNHFYSTYPVFSGITLTPIYYTVKLLAPEAFGYWQHEYSQRNGDLTEGIVSLMHKYSAAIISALTVIFFWLIASRLEAPAIVSIPTTIALAVGSPIMSSMALQVWSHGPAILFMLIAVYFSAILDEEKQTNFELGLGGLAAAWSVACRPSGLIAASLLAIYVLFKHGKHSFYFILSFLFLLFGIFYLNIDIYGTLFGGYQVHVDKFSQPTFQRLFQLLMSPSRGLIPFAPYVIILFLFIPKIFHRKIDLVTLSVMATAAELSIYSCWSVWWGGNCFGPRLLSDSIMWILLGILAANVHITSLRGLIPKTLWLSCLLFVAYSACLHITGAVYGDGNWDRDYFKGKSSLMEWKNSQITWTLTNIRYDPRNEWQKQ